MAKKKEEKTKTELRLERLKQKVAQVEAQINKRQEKANIKSQIEELKKKLKEMR